MSEPDPDHPDFGRIHLARTDRTWCDLPARFVQWVPPMNGAAVTCPTCRIEIDRLLNGPYSAQASPETGV